MQNRGPDRTARGRGMSFSGNGASSPGLNVTVWEALANMTAGYHDETDWAIMASGG
jgi:hypothetical protein